MLACVITPPEGLLSPTPTICVECVQATICAENATGDGCPTNASPTPVDSLPTLVPTKQDVTPTEEILATETPTTAVTLTVDVIPSATATSTLITTRTPTSTKTETAVPASSKTPTTTSTVQLGDWIYKTQTGSPKHTTNFAHPDLGCKWGGIAGQVFGPGGAPQPDVVVVVSGDVNGVPYDLVGFTGSAVKYGASAYEVEFPDGPVKTIGTLSIQLFDLAGKELSGKLPFDTFTECDKNLVIFNFILAN